MNLKECLESGIIEDYCLGVLPPDKVKMIAQFAAQFEEVQAAIEAYELALKKYAEGLAPKHVLI